MSKFLSPIENAKSLGFIYIILGVVELLSGGFLPWSVFYSILYLAVGISLYRKHIFGLYGFAVMTVLSLTLIIFSLFAVYDITISMYVSLILNGLLLLWFWKDKDKFNK